MRAALKAYVGELVLTYLIGRAWLEFLDRVTIAKERRADKRAAAFREGFDAGFARVQDQLRRDQAEPDPTPQP